VGCIAVSLCSSFLSFVLLGFVRQQQLLTFLRFKYSPLHPQQRHPLLRPVARDCLHRSFEAITNISLSRSLVIHHPAFELNHSNSLLCLPRKGKSSKPSRLSTPIIFASLLCVVQPAFGNHLEQFNCFEF
jgi:hypothetical protein